MLHDIQEVNILLLTQFTSSFGGHSSSKVLTMFVCPKHIRQISTPFLRDQAPVAYPDIQAGPRCGFQGTPEHDSLDTM